MFLGRIGASSNSSRVELPNGAGATYTSRTTFPAPIALTPIR